MIKEFIINLLGFLPDEIFCRLTFLIKHKRLPNLKSPKYFNDKLLFLKLNVRDKRQSKLVDKYEVRNYIKETIGEEYLIPLVGVYNKVEDVVIDNLPQKFVIKMTNGSQNNIICKDKSRFSWNKSQIKLNKWLKYNYYKRTREWPYKNVNNRIVIEEFLETKDDNLIDYKFFCFEGIPKFIQLDIDRFKGHKRDFYDMSFKKIERFNITYVNSNSKLEKPKNFDGMVKLVKKLAKPWKFVRIDFYNIEGAIYFGEITFYPGNCNEPVNPVEKRIELGSYLKI
ncbi:ATP-grasp fold amidoligase family protein [Tenacibaculum sp. SSH1-16]|uniref:ATP-grasp fold amidoligase family protein n=1 Tax=Tenacibaculum sp. SSH1-16 TaxID=3136667 RepID=UPI0032C41B8F|nr:ATP-grasp fold amidoligase family protein [Tenacibaculum mesophilum]